MARYSKRQAPRDDIGSPVLLSTIEAARYLQKPELTLATWRTRKRGPRYCKVGHSVRYRLADIDAWLDANVVEVAP